MPVGAIDGPWLILLGRFLCSPEPGELAGVFAVLDSVLIVAGVGFFAAAILYALACERM